MRRWTILLAVLMGAGLADKSFADITLWDECITLGNGNGNVAVSGDGIADLFYNPMTGTLTIDTDGTPLLAMVIEGPRATSAIDRFEVGKIYVGDISVPREIKWLHKYFGGSEQWGDTSLVGINGVFQFATYQAGLRATDFGSIQYGTVEGPIVYLDSPKPEAMDPPKPPVEPIEPVDPVTPPDIPAEPIEPVVIPEPAEPPDAPPDIVEPDNPLDIMPEIMPVDGGWIVRGRLNPVFGPPGVGSPGFRVPTLIIDPEFWDTYDPSVPFNIVFAAPDLEHSVLLTHDERQYSLADGHYVVHTMGNEDSGSKAIEGSVPEPSTPIGLAVALLVIGGWRLRRRAA